jgi:hypothetical protein
VTGEMILGAASKHEILSLNGNVFNGSIPSEIHEFQNLK